jgi:zinc protease
MIARTVARPAHLLCMMWLALLFLAASAGHASAALADRVAHAYVNGIDVYSYKSGTQDEVVLRGSLPAGDRVDPSENPAIAALVAGMLDKGTRRHDKFALAEMLDTMGASIRFDTDPSALNIRVRCLRESLPLVIAVLAEELRTPAFAPEELVKFKTQYIGVLRARLEDTSARAQDAFRRAAFPAGHVNHVASIEERIGALDRASEHDLRRFHATHYRPDQLRLVAVGDVDLSTLRPLLKKEFGRWSVPAAKTAVPRVTGRTASTSAVEMSREQTIFIPGKTSATLVWGQATGLRYSDPDALALRVGTAIFGSGFTGRLMAGVRDRDGLTYGISARMRDDTYADGYWLIAATFAPQLLERGVASTQRELMSWLEHGVTAAELESRKTNLIGEYQVSLASPMGMADTILTTRERGYSLEWLDAYPGTVMALTVRNVNDVIRKYLDPQKMVRVRAGTIPTERD